MEGRTPTINDGEVITERSLSGPEHKYHEMGLTGPGTHQLPCMSTTSTGGATVLGLRQAGNASKWRRATPPLPPKEI